MPLTWAKTGPSACFGDSQRWPATSHEELKVYGNKCLDAYQQGECLVGGNQSWERPQ